MTSLNFIVLYWKKSMAYENIYRKQNLYCSTTYFVHVFNSNKYLVTLKLYTESDISDVFWPKLEWVHKFKLK
jgi:uncharacterized Fe-S cluster-containing protein